MSNLATKIISLLQMIGVDEVTIKRVNERTVTVTKEGSAPHYYHTNAQPPHPSLSEAHLVVELNKLRESYNTVTRGANTLRACVDNHTDTIKKLKAEKEQLQTHIENRDDTIDAKNEVIEELKKEVDLWRTHSDELHREISVLQEIMCDKGKSNAELYNLYQSLNIENESLKKDIEVWHKYKEDLLSRIKDLEADIKDLHATNANLGEKLNEKSLQDDFDGKIIAALLKTIVILNQEKS